MFFGFVLFLILASITTFQALSVVVGDQGVTHQFWPIWLWPMINFVNFFRMEKKWIWRKKSDLCRIKRACQNKCMRQLSDIFLLSLTVWSEKCAQKTCKFLYNIPYSYRRLMYCYTIWIFFVCLFVSIQDEFDIREDQGCQHWSKVLYWKWSPSKIWLPSFHSNLINYMSW